MTQRISLVLAAIGVLASCRMVAPPDPAEGLGPHSKVYAPVLEEEIGELFVQSDGLWAFLTPESARAKAYRTGQVVVFGDLEETRRHLFAVVETATWGVRLQRLDVDRVEARDSGTLIPLGQLDLHTGVRWAFCAGEGDIASSDCLKRAEPGTRWWVYPLAEAAGTLKVDAESGLEGPTLPIPLLGQVSVGPLGVDVVGTTLPERWLAVPGAVGPRPTRPRIAVQSGCNVGSPHREALDAQWISTDVRAPADALQISSEAVRLGADALVWCDKESARVAVPSLYRPQIEVIGRNFGVPPMLGTAVVEIPRTATHGTDLVARLGAAVSTGDFESANYYAEALSRTVEAKRPADRVLVDVMSAIAEGGRPEFAARMGGWATRLQWNPDNSPAWQLGMARVEEALGNRKGAIARTAELSDLLDRVGDDAQRGWMGYFWTLTQLQARGAAKDSLEGLSSSPELALAARAEVARSKGEPIDALRQDFEARKALDLWLALSGDPGKRTCEAPGCAADSYGSLWHAGAVPPSALSRVRTILLRPGFLAAHAAPADPFEHLESLTSLYPLLDEAGRDSAISNASRAALDWADVNCASGLPEGSKLQDLDALGRDAALRLTDDRPADLAMTWLTTNGLQAACTSSAALAESAAELAETTGTTEIASAFFELQVTRASSKQLAPALEAAASFATRFERGERCALWTTALAAAYAEASDFDNAGRWTQESTHCDTVSRQTLDLVSAYLNFQRTSSTSADFADTVRNELRRITHANVPRDRCVGIEDLGYRIVPALPPGARELAARLAFAPAASGDELSLVTANDRLTNAREHLSTVARLMETRDFVGAAKTLGHARDAFEQVGHEVGLAQCSWLDGLLFGGKSAEIARGDAEFSKAGIESLRRKGLLSELTDPSAQLAVALLHGKSADARALVGDKLPLRSTLCEPAVARPRGVVLDTSGGELKAVGRPDDGPEIELVDPSAPEAQ